MYRAQLSRTANLQSSTLLCKLLHLHLLLVGSAKVRATTQKRHAAHSCVSTSSTRPAGHSLHAPQPACTTAVTHTTVKRLPRYRRGRNEATPHTGRATRPQSVPGGLEPEWGGGCVGDRTMHMPKVYHSYLRGNQEREGVDEGEAGERWQHGRGNSGGGGRGRNSGGMAVGEVDPWGAGKETLAVRRGSAHSHAHTCRAAFWPYHQRPSVSTGSPETTALPSIHT